MPIAKRVAKLEAASGHKNSDMYRLVLRAFKGDEEPLRRIDALDSAVSEQAGRFECHPDVAAAVAELPREVLVEHAVRHGLEATLPPGLMYLLPALKRSIKPWSGPKLSGWPPVERLTPEFLAAEADRIGASHLVPASWK